MAGPCSVEGEEMLIETARHVAARGARMLRGGAFKPRTSPYSFQGLGEAGLKMLAMAREETGLRVVSEGVTPADGELCARYLDVALSDGAQSLDFAAFDRMMDDLQRMTSVLTQVAAK